MLRIGRNDSILSSLKLEMRKWALKYEKFTTVVTKEYLYEKFMDGIWVKFCYGAC